MNVLIVTHRFPPHTGGVETHVEEIATRLVTSGHDVTVFSADAGRDVEASFVDEGVQVRRFKSLSPGNAFYVAPELTLAVRRFNADVVHAHNYHAFPLFFAAIGVTDEHLVVTPHYHGASASGFRDLLLTCYRPFGRWAVRRADEVIAVSTWEKEKLATDFGVDATIIPNGVDVERFADSEEIQRGRPYILTVGRLENYKGVQHVIRAMSELPEFDLVITGTGPYREELERIARDEGVEHRVEFLGYVNDDKLPGLYAGAEAFITMSEFEAYGMAVGEALAAGTPCVVRETGGLKSWVTAEGVFGVTEVSPEPVSRAINAAVGSQVGTTPLYDWDEVCREISDIYEGNYRGTQ